MFYLEKEDIYIDTSPENYYYLCTVYSKHPDGLDKAYEEACMQQALLVQRGLFVYSPITHNHDFQKILGIHTHSFWLPLDFKFIKLSKGIIVCKMKNWENSYGIAEEIKFAKHLGLPIYYCNFMDAPVELFKDV